VNNKVERRSRDVILQLTGDVQSVRPQEKQYLIFSEDVACSALLFSVPSYLSFIRLLVFLFLPRSFDTVSIVKFILVAVWETAGHRLRYLTAIFVLTAARISNPILIFSSYIILEYNMNYQNVSLCLDSLMKE
jgi:hypothetical protein